jgi:hypothetical protein
MKRVEENRLKQKYKTFQMARARAGEDNENETRRLRNTKESKLGASRKGKKNTPRAVTHHAWTKICFALSDALVVVAALTLAARCSSA